MEISEAGEATVVLPQPSSASLADISLKTTAEEPIQKNRHAESPEENGGGRESERETAAERESNAGRVDRHPASHIFERLQNNPSSGSYRHRKRFSGQSANNLTGARKTDRFREKRSSAVSSTGSLFSQTLGQLPITQIESAEKAQEERDVSALEEFLEDHYVFAAQHSASELDDHMDAVRSSDLRAIASDSQDLSLFFSSPVPRLLRKRRALHMILLIALLYGARCVAACLALAQRDTSGSAFRIAPSRLRDNTQPILSPHVDDVTLTRRGCVLEMENMTESVEGRWKHLSFPRAVSIDGILVTTSSLLPPSADPVELEIQVKAESGEWEAVGQKAWRVSLDLGVLRLPTTHTFPSERGAQVQLGLRPAWGWAGGSVGAWGTVAAGLVGVWALAWREQVQRAQQALAGTAAVGGALCVAAGLSLRADGAPESAPWGVHAATLLPLAATLALPRLAALFVPALCLSALLELAWVFVDAALHHDSALVLVLLETYLSFGALALGLALLLRRRRRLAALSQSVAQDQARFDAVWRELLSHPAHAAALLELQELVDARAPDAPTNHWAAAPDADAAAERKSVMAGLWESGGRREVRSVDQVYAQASCALFMLRRQLPQWALQSRALVLVRPEGGGRGAGGRGGLAEPEREEGEEGEEGEAATYVRYSRVVRRGWEERVVWEALKPPQRCIRKALDLHHRHVSSVVDVCRQTLVFEAAPHLTLCLRTLLCDPSVAVLRIRSTLEPAPHSASSAGFRCVKVNLRWAHLLARSLGCHGHTFELLLVLRSFHTLLSPAAHERFLLFRSVRSPSRSLSHSAPRRFLSSLFRPLFRPRTHPPALPPVIPRTESAVSASTVDSMERPERKLSGFGDEAESVPQLGPERLRGEEVAVPVGPSLAAHAGEREGGGRRSMAKSEGVSELERCLDGSCSPRSRMISVGKATEILMRSNSERAPASKTTDERFVGDTGSTRARMISVGKAAELLARSSPDQSKTTDDKGGREAWDRMEQQLGVWRRAQAGQGAGPGPGQASNAESELEGGSGEGSGYREEMGAMMLKQLLVRTSRERAQIDREKQLVSDAMSAAASVSVFTTSFPIAAALCKRWFIALLSATALLFVFFAIQEISKAQRLGYSSLPLIRFTPILLPPSAPRPTPLAASALPVFEAVGVLQGACRRTLPLANATRPSQSAVVTIGAPPAPARRHNIYSAREDWEGLQPQAAVPNAAGEYWYNGVWFVVRAGAVAEGSEHGPSVGFAVEGSADGEAWELLATGSGYVTQGGDRVWRQAALQGEWVAVDARVSWHYRLRAMLANPLVSAGTLGCALCGMLHKQQYGKWCLVGCYSLVVLVWMLEAIINMARGFWPEAWAALVFGGCTAVLVGRLAWCERHLFWTCLLVGFLFIGERVIENLLLYPAPSNLAESPPLTGSFFLLLGSCLLAWKRFAVRRSWRAIQHDHATYQRAWHALCGQREERRALLELEDLCRPFAAPPPRHAQPPRPLAPLPGSPIRAAPALLLARRRSSSQPPSRAASCEFSTAVPASPTLAAWRRASTSPVPSLAPLRGAPDSLSPSPEGSHRFRLPSPSPRSPLHAALGFSRPASIDSAASLAPSEDSLTRLVCRRGSALLRPFWRPATHSPRSHPATPLVRSLDQIFVQAAGLHPILIRKIQAWALPHDGLFPAMSDDGKEAERGKFVAWKEVSADANAARRVKWASLKKEGRAVEKLVRVYKGEAAKVVDICRQSIVFEHAASMHRCVAAIISDPDVRIVRIKNRMRDRYDAMESVGYRDVSMNLHVVTEETRRLCIDSHVCEVQLLLKPFAQLKSEQGHKRYVAYRNSRGQ